MHLAPGAALNNIDMQSITGNYIDNGAIDGSHLSTYAALDNIGPNGITGYYIGSGVIDGMHLAPGAALNNIDMQSITGNYIDNGAIDGSHLAIGAALGNIADGSITQSKLASLNLNLGDTLGGGTVFWVNANGSHGLIVSNTDQHSSASWFEAQDKVVEYFVTQGATQSVFTDWRLPTKKELDLIYQATPSILTSGTYWSSTESDTSNAHSQSGANSTSPLSKSSNAKVRAVRSF
jgi:hypothetical protein